MLNQNDRNQNDIKSLIYNSQPEKVLKDFFPSYNCKTNWRELKGVWGSKHIVLEEVIATIMYTAYKYYQDKEFVFGFMDKSEIGAKRKNKFAYQRLDEEQKERIYNLVIYFYKTNEFNELR